MNIKSIYKFHTNIMHTYQSQSFREEGDGSGMGNETSSRKEEMEFYSLFYWAKLN